MSSVSSSPVLAPTTTLSHASEETQLSGLLESIQTDLNLPSFGISGEATSRYLKLADRLTQAFPQNVSVITDLYSEHVNTKHGAEVRSFLRESLLRLMSEQTNSDNASKSDEIMQREGVPLLVHSLVVDEALKESPGESGSGTIL